MGTPTCRGRARQGQRWRLSATDPAAVDTRPTGSWSVQVPVHHAFRSTSSDCNTFKLMDAGRTNQSVPAGVGRGGIVVRKRIIGVCPVGAIRCAVKDRMITSRQVGSVLIAGHGESLYGSTGVRVDYCLLSRGRVGIVPLGELRVRVAAGRGEDRAPRDGWIRWQGLVVRVPQCDIGGRETEGG